MGSVKRIHDNVLNAIKNNHYYKHIATYLNDDTYIPPVPPKTVVSSDNKATYTTDKKVFVSADASVMS
jgi:hypothetical protein